MSAGSFEKNLEKLEGIVEKLETGDMQLDEALKEFEGGVRLLKQLNEQLEESGRRVEVLLSEQGESEVFDEQATESQGDIAGDKVEKSRKKNSRKDQNSLFEEF